MCRRLAWRLGMCGAAATARRGEWDGVSGLGCGGGGFGIGFGGGGWFSSCSPHTHSACGLSSSAWDRVDSGSGASLRGELALIGTSWECIMRCVTAWAFSEPQSEAMTSSRGFGPGMQGGGDQGEAKLCRLMVAVAVVWSVVCRQTMPSGSKAVVASLACLCRCENPECR